MNTYYSNLIEGQNTRPREIEQALHGIQPEDDRRDLKIEAVAHYRVQQEMDEREAAGTLLDPAHQNSFVASTAPFMTAQ